MQEFASAHPPAEPSPARHAPTSREPRDPGSGAHAPARASRERERAQIRTLAAISPIVLLDATYLRHRFSRHSHDELEIGVNVAGVARVSIGGRTRRLQPGHVLLAAPGEAHAAQREGQDPWEYRALWVPPALLAPAAEAAGCPLPSLRFRSPIVYDPELSDGLVALHQRAAERGGRGGARRRLDGLLARCLGRHAGMTTRHDRQREARHPAIHLVRKHLETHFARSVPLEELAELSELSRYHLLRLFRDAVGLPPNAYQQCLRIRESQRLLRSGRCIAEIAPAVGFASVSHFTRQFKKIVGAPPGIWVRGVRRAYPGPAA